MESSSNNLNKPVYSRVAVTYCFFILGTLTGNYIVRIPDLQNKFDLSKGQLGLLLTGIPIGSVLIMLFVGKLISKYGSKTTTIMGALLFHLSIPVLFLIPNIYALWVILMIDGIGATVLDVSMNSQGVEVERLLKSSIMSSLHAFFSIGGVVGAIMGGLFVSFNISPEVHLLTVSILFLPFTLYSFRYLRSEKLAPVYNNGKRASNKEIFMTKEILLLGIIAFIGVLAELMMNDWSLIYILTFTKNEASIAALGFATFSLFMTIGRLSGDPILNRMSAKNAIRIFSGIGAIGLIISVLTSNIVIIFLGFALLGLGISILVPIVFKIAGNNDKIEIGSGIAGVAFFAYASGIIEPVFVGQVADVSSLKVAFFIVALAIGSIILFAKGVRQVNSSSGNQIKI